MTAKHDRWYPFETCKGKRKDGRSCNAQPVRPYEERPGNLIIPLCCWWHRDQEAALAHSPEEVQRERAQEEGK